MVAKAFNAETGPLTLSTDPAGERQGMQQFVAGAVSVFKTPAASHLLRVVDSRRALSRHKGARKAQQSRNHLAFRSGLLTNWKIVRDTNRPGTR